MAQGIVLGDFWKSREIFIQDSEKRFFRTYQTLPTFTFEWVNGGG
jgi:hypothetical protein